MNGLMMTVFTSLALLGQLQQPAGLEPASLLERAPAQISLPQQEIFFSSDWSGPAPTNRWWSSLLWERYSLPIWADPLSLRARADGLAVGWPVQEASQAGFSSPHRDSLRVSVPGLSADAALVAGFSDWTVDVDWEDALSVTVMKGSPYLWITAHAGRLRLSGARAAGLISEGEREAVSFSDNQERDWLLILPPGASVELGATLEVSLTADRGLALAAVPEPAATGLLIRHAFSRPGITRVSWEWLREEGVVEASFDFGSSEPVLTGLYPHQYARSDHELTPFSFLTPRGQLRLAVTDSFTMRLPFHGVMPALPAGERAGEATALLHEYVTGTRRLFGLMPGQTRESDSYSDGKSFGRLVSLVMIAEQAGEHAVAGQLLDAIKDRLEDWFSADASPWLHYDTNWGALLASPTSHGHDSQLNDHPFHYGYFLQAAATVAERDPDWAATWGPAVDLLVRDTAAGRNDQQFPFLRALDPYTGHGWASGSGRYERGNNLESSSEALNHAAGLIRWAEAVGDDGLLQLGAFLYASQVDTVWHYWFGSEGNFPPGFGRTAVGIVWSDGAAYTTWWTGQPGAIHGINFLPFTSASVYLGRDRQFVLDNYREMTSDAAHYWPDIALQYLALADPQRALHEWSRELPVEFGESRAKTLWYLGSFARHGSPMTGISSDFAQSGVLGNSSGRTYLAFNPGSEDRNVTFSDGTTFLVRTHSLGERRIQTGADE